MSELKSQDLIIALEPECASLHCRKLPANEFPGITSKNFKLSTGTKYMVIDMGGKTRFRRILPAQHQIRLNLSFNLKPMVLGGGGIHYQKGNVHILSQ